MISDKNLFALMIKYRQTFVGWLNYTKIISKTENGFVLADNNNIESLESIESIDTINTKPIFKPLLIDNDGITRISYPGYDKNKLFSKIHLVKGANFKDIIDSGIVIYDIDNCSERYCHVSQLEELICNFSENLLDVTIPDNFHRLNGKAKWEYINILKRQIAFVKNNNYQFIGYYSFNYSIKGEFLGYGHNSPQKQVNIEQYGIFANSSIYKKIEWNFDMVEEYKDNIMWLELMLYSNLIWTEDNLIKYDTYIPYCVPDQRTYCDKFKTNIDYSKFGFLSNLFLDSHKEVLEWRDVFEKCKFRWNASELSYFCKYALSIDLPYSESFSNTTAASQIEFSLDKLLDNHNFVWESENLFEFLMLSEHNWSALVHEHRPNLFKIFKNIPNIEKIASPFVANIESFWEIINHDSDFPYDKSTPEFTIQNIIENFSNWSNRIKDKFSGMRRTPDTNYHFYQVITQWDIYCDRINIPLTFEIAKYLSTREIKFGGGFIESDGGYIEEDNRYPMINGLLAFSQHHFANKEEALKCLEDPAVVDILLNPQNQTNIDLIKVVIESFFYNYTVAEYLDVINKLHDWDNIKEYG